MSEKIKAWSASRYNTYNQCPFKAKRLYIDKAKMEENDAMKRGKKIHKLGEQYLKMGGKMNLPIEYNYFAKEMEYLIEMEAESEHQFAFNVAMKEVEWFAGDAWLRVTTDVIYYDAEPDTLHIIDFKTGKFKDDMDDYERQLELYALALFAVYDVQNIQAELWFLDEPPPVRGRGNKNKVILTFSHDEYNKLYKKWMKRVKPLLTDEVFEPKSNQYCKWCQFGSGRKGDGTCKFGES